MEIIEGKEKIDQIREFLIEANKVGYGGGEEKKWIKETDHSTTIAYESGDWKFHDNFFGGEPYGGREVIFQGGQPVWLMVYYGLISDKTLDKNIVYKFLQSALMEAPADLPLRGPDHFEQEIEGQKWVYENKANGTMENFSGQEKIFIDSREIFYTDYSGGLVDLPRD